MAPVGSRTQKEKKKKKSDIGVFMVLGLFFGFWFLCVFSFFFRFLILIHCQDLEIEKFQIKSGFPASGEKADLGTAGLCFLMATLCWLGGGVAFFT